MLLELGIFLSHIIWLLRTRKLRKAARESGKTFDDVAAEHEEQGIPFKFRERKGQKACIMAETDPEKVPQAVDGGVVTSPSPPSSPREPPSELRK